jgi:hypothetical protein
LVAQASEFRGGGRTNGWGGEFVVTGDHKLTALRHFAVRFADLD